MEQRHNYEYQVDANARTAAARVVRMVGTDKRVLEVGAGPGSITRLLKEHGNCRITAIEVDETAINKLAPFCERVYQSDLNDASWTSNIIAQDEKFDVVVAADVLEHLYHPVATLRAMSGILDKDGYVVVSLPHIGHNAVIACLVDEDFAYQDWGLLDRTHIRFFGIKNIQQLFDEAGFKIVEAEFVVKPPEHTEFADRWRRTSHALKKNLSQNRFGLVYQVVIKAKPDSIQDEGLDLLLLPVPEPSSAFPPGTPLGKRAIHTLKIMLFPYISLKNRTRLAHLLNRMGFRL